MTGLRRSWVESANNATTDFPLNNLPYGVFRHDGAPYRCGVGIGDWILDLTALEEAGVLRLTGDPVFDRPRWNALMAQDPKVWAELRNWLLHALSEVEGDPDGLAPYLHPMAGAQMALPFDVSGFTDFFASHDHALNAVHIRRGPEAEVPGNWSHIPIGYNGRASTVRVSGTPVVRPCGQILPDGAARPVFGPEPWLDFELELGAVVGMANPPGQAVDMATADRMIFGHVLINDWSARSIQFWESQPLGPFLGKSFATTISPWIVTAAALAPARAEGPRIEPPVLDYLAAPGPVHYDIDLFADIELATGERMQVTRTRYQNMHFSLTHQLCHHASNGTEMRVGDLLGSGTVSGPDRDNRGCMLELSWGGAEPLVFPSGATRTYLEDGDSVILSGHAQCDGFRIGFGTCEARVVPAADLRHSD